MKEIHRSIRDLYPTFTEEQLRESEVIIDDYLEFVVRLHKRIAADPEEYARFRTLTQSEPYRTIKALRAREPLPGPPKTAQDP